MGVHPYREPGRELPDRYAEGWRALRHRRVFGFAALIAVPLALVGVGALVPSQSVLPLVVAVPLLAVSVWGQTPTCPVCGKGFFDSWTWVWLITKTFAPNCMSCGVRRDAREHEVSRRH